MEILDFLNKYNYVITHTPHLQEDWNRVKNCDPSHFVFLMEQLIEKRFPETLIKDLFNSAPNEIKDEFKNHSDLFKWSAAFHSEEIIEFFYENLNIKNEHEQGAINAAIINFRLDNLKTLNKFGINVFADNHFCQAIQRSHQTKSSAIVEYYLQNKDKFEMTDFSKDLLCNQHESLLRWMTKDQNLEQLSYLIKQGAKFDRGELLKTACANGEIQCLKYLLDSDDFKLRPDVPPLNEKAISEGFIFSISAEEMELVEYFIFEKNIKKTRSISSKIKDRPEIASLFLARDINNELLQKKSQVNSPKRIKI